MKYPKVLKQYWIDNKNKKRITLWFLHNNRGEYLDDFTKLYFGDGQTANYNSLTDCEVLTKKELNALNKGDLDSLYKMMK